MTSVDAALTADEYRAALDEAIDFARSCTPQQWEAVTSEEGWTVAATVHHIAVGNQLIAGWIESIRAGEAVELTAEEQDEENADHASEYAQADKGQTVTLLTDGGADAEALIRSLTEAELARTAPFGPAGGRDLSCAQAAEAALTHVRTHLDHARSAAGVDA